MVDITTLDLSDEELDKALSSEVVMRQVIGLVAICHLQQYKSESLHFFHRRVARAICWAETDSDNQPYSAGQAIRGYMSIQ